jgi:hypothetical protein
LLPGGGSANRGAGFGAGLSYGQAAIGHRALRFPVGVGAGSTRRLAGDSSLFSKGALGSTERRYSAFLDDGIPTALLLRSAIGQPRSIGILNLAEFGCWRGARDRTASWVLRENGGGRTNVRWTRGPDGIAVEADFAGALNGIPVDIELATFDTIRLARLVHRRQRFQVAQVVVFPLAAIAGSKA